MNTQNYYYLLKWYKAFGINTIYNYIPQNLNSGNHEQTPERTPKESPTPTNNHHDSIDKLKKDIENIDCLIKRTAHNTVIYDGPLDANLMIIGEAPGQDEDIQGKPFVGQSGILLNNMLYSIGYNRESVLISNIVFWRPPGNRTPSADEISLCLPYVKRLINIVKPNVILLMGSVATHAILNNNLPISKCRGKVTEVNGIKFISTFHPAYLLRSSTQKKLVFNDLILVIKMLKKS